jgi:hypothetical protein
MLFGEKFAECPANARPYFSVRGAIVCFYFEVAKVVASWFDSFSSSVRYGPAFLRIKSKTEKHFKMIDSVVRRIQPLAAFQRLCNTPPIPCVVYNQMFLHHLTFATLCVWYIRY